MTPKQLLKKVVVGSLSGLFPEAWKQWHEFGYWKRQQAITPTLRNDHYERYYKEHFGLSDDDYAGKRVLDIGCGPRGSLEWAGMTARRVGLDPLADRYQELRSKPHAMEYVSVPSERMPFEDDEFDFVTTFNSLDHVADLTQTVAQIKRVLRRGGTCLVLVEINQPANPCEPHSIVPSNFLKQMAPELVCEELRAYRDIEGRGMYGSIDADRQFENPSTVTELGWLSARFSAI